MKPNLLLHSRLWPMCMVVLLIAVLLSGTACTQKPDIPEDTPYYRYMKQLLVKREENWFQKKVREFQTYPHLHRAHRFIKADRMKEARAEFQEYLAIDPLDLKVRFSYLIVLSMMKENQEAFHQASLILQQQPNFVPGLIYRGMAYQSLDQYEKATEDFKSVIAIPELDKKDWIFALNMIADLGIQGKMYSDALVASQNLIEIEKNFNNYLRKGIALEGLNRFKGAEEAYRLALSYAQNSEEQMKAYLCLGEVAKKQKDWNSAQRAFLSGLRLEPQNPELMRVLGELSYSRKDYPEAAKWVRKALTLRADPKDREFLANILFLLKDYQAAAGEFTQLLHELETQEGRYRIYMALGNVYTTWGKYSQATSAFQKAAQIKRDLPTLTALAQTFEREGRLSEAVQYYKEMLKLHPGAETHLNLGLLYAKMGEDKNALYHLEKAAKSDLPPSQKVRAYKQLVFTYSKLNKHVDAQRALKQALAIKEIRSPQRAAILENLGFMYMRLDQYKLAADYLQRAIDAGNDGWRIRQDLGHALFKLKQWEDALRQFRKSLEYKRTSRSLIFMGRCYKELNKPGLAIHYLRLALLSGANGADSPTTEVATQPLEIYIGEEDGL